MDIENIVENAVARATVQFQKDYEAEYIRQNVDKDLVGIWAGIEAYKAVIPDLVKNALILALKEIYQKDKQDT